MMLGVYGIKIGVNNTMEIAICDDEKVFRQNIKDILISYRNKNRFEINIYEFETGEAFLQSDRKYDVVFLDYQMPGLDGLETARRLREKNSICTVIFVTNYPEFILDSFEVQPFRFMVKPLEDDKVLEAMHSYIEKQKLFFPIAIMNDGELKRIASQDIRYLEGNGKYSIIHTTEQSLDSSKTLTKMHKLLPPYCFYRVHKSYIVNMFCVESIKGDLVTLNRGESIKVSRTQIAKFKKAYTAFLKNSFVRV